MQLLTFIAAGGIAFGFVQFMNSSIQTEDTDADVIVSGGGPVPPQAEVTTKVKINAHLMLINLFPIQWIEPLQ